MSEISEGASEGSFQDLPNFSSELQNPILNIGSGTAMEISAYTTTEKISGTLSYTKEPTNCLNNCDGRNNDNLLSSHLQTSHGMDYCEWSKEFKQRNHLLTVGKSLPAQHITTVPSHLGQPTTTQSNDPSNKGQDTVSTFNQLESFNSQSTISPNKLPDPLNVSSLQNQFDKNDTVAPECRNSMEPLPERALNPASCPFWKAPSSSYGSLPVSSSCRTALADRFNQSAKFVDSCDVSDNYSMTYSPLENEALRNDQTSSYPGSNLHILENLGYGLSGDNNLEINSIGQDHGYQTEPSTQEDMYSSDYPYFEDDEEEQRYNCLDSSIRSINYCQTGASGEDLYDPSVIVDQLEASVRQQVDFQVQSFQNNLHEAIYEQLNNFRELVTMQATNIGHSVPLKTSQRIHSIDSGSPQRHCLDDSSDCQQMSREAEEQLEENQLSNTLIQLLTHSNRLCIALSREQYT